MPGLKLGFGVVEELHGPVVGDASQSRVFVTTPDHFTTVKALEHLGFFTHIIIDEGHASFAKFRPVLTVLKHFKIGRPKIRIIVLTATAPLDVQADIRRDLLKLGNQVLNLQYLRTNLKLLHFCPEEKIGMRSFLIPILIKCRSLKRLPVLIYVDQVNQAEQFARLAWQNGFEGRSIPSPV